MSVMSIRIDDEKRKKLKAIASLQGKTMNSIVEELIDQYIEEFTNNNEWSDDVIGIMKVSEPSFEEWENDEDAIYDEL
jgi:predicted transcriptional regulator